VARRLGDLAIVLHSHMPYVEGYGTYPFGEEWLFDAVLRSYLPVLDVAERLTVTVTPVLADQLEAQDVSERLEAFGQEFRLGAAEADAADVEPDLRPACEAEAERYRLSLKRLSEVRGPVTEAFAAAGEGGRVELMPSAATHAVLPLVATDGCRRLQIDAGLRSHRRRFGPADGFWLPECAYEPGLEGLLAERGIRFFCTDQSAHEGTLDALIPVLTRDGVVAFTIDWTAVSWLWSWDGYPSSPEHADFHRKSMRGTRPWSIGGSAYDPEGAVEVARRQAAEFVDAVAERLASFRDSRGRVGLVTFAIDTELLGHWWWEGPDWLAEVIRLAPDRGVDLVTLSGALERHEPAERPLRATTWGEGKDLRTWDSPDVADMTWAARRLELRLIRALVSNGLPTEAQTRAVRELLALQASDWAFLDKRRQAGDYAYQRATGHARALLEAIHSPEGSDPAVRNLAPDVTVDPLLEP
jgi:1,4-alpha-glucan branching enzyme